MELISWELMTRAIVPCLSSCCNLAALNLPVEGMSLEVRVGMAGLWLVFVAVLAAIAKRFTPPGSELVRKVVHIGTGNIILLAWGLQIPAWVGITAAIVFGGVALASYRYPLLPSLDTVGRRSWGTFFYAASIGILVAWFWPLHLPQFTALGILVMAWGDGLAGLVGQHFGRHPYQLWGMKKSWEGSLTMAIVSGVITLAVLLPLQENLVQENLAEVGLTALAVSILATVLEAFSKLGIDNLTVPLGSAAIAYLLSQLW
ncbi:MAG: SEC59/DGK1/VTE5 family protein [Synechococcales bacterium]|nr:SEC59/DGK1/VTE5 family protein [Synechococcales bacterium]